MAWRSLKLVVYEKYQSANLSALGCIDPKHSSSRFLSSTDASFSISSWALANVATLVWTNIVYCCWSTSVVCFSPLPVTILTVGGTCKAELSSMILYSQKSWTGASFLFPNGQMCCLNTKHLTFLVYQTAINGTCFFTLDMLASEASV